MFDAVMVRREAVLDAPQDSLGPTADFDLAVDRADVGGRRSGLRYVSAATSALLLPSRNEGQDLRLSVAEPFASPGPIESNGAARPRRNVHTQSY